MNINERKNAMKNKDKFVLNKSDKYKLNKDDVVKIVCALITAMATVLVAFFARDIAADVISGNSSITINLDELVGEVTILRNEILKLLQQISENPDAIIFTDMRTAELAEIITRDVTSYIMENAANIFITEFDTDEFVREVSENIEIPPDGITINTNDITNNIRDWLNTNANYTQGFTDMTERAFTSISEAIESSSSAFKSISTAIMSSSDAFRDSIEALSDAVTLSQ